MRIAKEQIPVKVNAPGAVARQQENFGDASGFSMMGAEYFSLAQGADMSSLLVGLENDLCHSPHWGYVIEGEIIVKFRDGSEECPRAGDMFYWPPWHTVRVTRDAEFVLFSPQHEHGAVMDHVNTRLES